MTTNTQAQSAQMRVMLIGLPMALASQISNLRAEGMDVVIADRPGEALRRFDMESPDVVALGVGSDPEQSALILQALRDRPLGALVPVALVHTGHAPHHPLTTPAGAAEAGADHYFGPGTPATSLMQGMGDLLGVILHTPGMSSSPSSRRRSSGSLSRPLSRSGRTPPPPPPSRTNLREDPASQPTRKTRNKQVRSYDSAMAQELRPTPYQPDNLDTPSPELLSPRHVPQRSKARQHGTVNGDVIRLKLRQIRHEDYFSILDLRKSADISSIEQSFQLLRRRFEASRVAAPLADRHHNELREICDALEDAFAVLSNTDLREDYLRALLQR